MSITPSRPLRLLRRRRATRLLAVAAVASLVVAACGDDDDDAGSAATTGSAPAATTATPATDAAAPATEVPGTEAPAATTGGGDTTEPATTDTAAPPTGDPYTVQIISDMTGGAAAALGIPGASGFQLALDEANESGGANGHPIEFDIVDSLSTGPGGEVAAQQAVSSNPTLIAHTGSSSSLNGAIPTWTSAALPTVAISGFDTLQFPTSPWFYAIATTDHQYASMFVEQMKGLFGGSLEGVKIAEEAVDFPSARTVSAAVVSLATEEGAEAVGQYIQPAGAASFSSQAQAIVDSGAQVVTVADQAASAVIIAKALETAGYEGYILASQGANDAVTLQGIGSDRYQAVRVVNEPVPGDSISTAAESFGLDATGAYFAQGYALGSFAVDALSACEDPCGPAEFEASTDALGTIELPEGLAFGPLQVAPDRHYLLTKVAWFAWDPAKSEAVEVGVVDITDGAPS